MRWTALVFVAVVTLTAACAPRGSGHQFVRNPSVGTYLRVPDTWSVETPATETDIRLEYATDFFVPGKAGDAPSGFDGSVPYGLLRVWELSGDIRDSISLAGARNVLVREDILEAARAQRLQLYRAETVALEDGFRGESLVFRTTSPRELPMTVAQVTLMDQRTTRLYVLGVGCSPECYVANQEAITEIVTSFTVKEK